MKFILYKVSGYEEAIMALRMSKGKFYSEKIARNIQQLVNLVTDSQGFICSKSDYISKLSVGRLIELEDNGKVTGDYEQDVAEFKRLLGLTFDNAMGAQTHHTLMKYIDVTFITEGLHRGAQDDLDAHAMAFNNRITRFSTRLAEIENVELSDWYKDKVIPFGEVDRQSDAGDLLAQDNEGYLTMFYPELPETVSRDNNNFVKTPFGYVLDKFAQVPAKNGLAKDVQRGLMPLGLSSNAIWKTDIFNLRYVYKMRSKLTKANPELKEGMEQLADQIEQHLPVFGEYFRKELTDTGVWEHQNKVRTISSDEYTEFKKWKKELEK